MSRVAEVDLSGVPTRLLRDEYLARVVDRPARVRLARVSLETLLDEGAQFLGESVERMQDRRRTKDLARKRQVLMVAIRRFTGAALQTVAELFTRIDHGAVMWAERRMEDRGHPEHEKMQCELLGVLALFEAMKSLEEGMER